MEIYGQILFLLTLILLTDTNWPQNGDIKFINFSTRYRTQLDNVLNQLSFEINSGEKIGVCGRTGAGKSSLAMSILRILNPSEGRIEIAGKVS